MSKLKQRLVQLTSNCFRALSNPQAYMSEEKGQQPGYVTCASTSTHTDEVTALLLALPAVLLQPVLGMLGPYDLLQLLQSSKGMAQAVMQHSPGRLTLKMKPQQGINMTAINWVLQWAPPTCLKVMLDGTRHHWLSPKADWELISSMFGSARIRSDSHQRQNVQQLPSIMEICIKGFSLLSLVPVELAAACPHLRTLHLQECDVTEDPQESCSDKSSGPSRGVRPADQLYTLVLKNVRMGCIVNHPFASTRDTGSMLSAAAAPVAKQIKASVPNVSCLKLLGNSSQYGFLELLAPQLKELHMTEDWNSSSVVRDMRGQLQQLQKLVCPHASVCTAEDMDFLLSLPNLRHVELSSVGQLQGDYSTAPCKWQYLQLHLNNIQGLFLVALSQLPLHSLTHPLTLGSPTLTKLVLPSPESHSLAALERLIQQLSKCGVKVMSRDLAWVGPISNEGALLAGAQMAAAFRVIAPAFGLLHKISLRYITIDQPILEAVAAVYQDSLKNLECDDCEYTADMQPAWHAALSGLSAVQHVGLSPRTHNYPEVLRCVRSLAAAMMQQPAGRCINVSGYVYSLSPQKLSASEVLDGAEDLLAVVEVTDCDNYFDGIRIKSIFGRSGHASS